MFFPFDIDEFCEFYKNKYNEKISEFDVLSNFDMFFNKIETDYFASCKIVIIGDRDLRDAYDFLQEVQEVLDFKFLKEYYKIYKNEIKYTKLIWSERKYILAKIKDIFNFSLDKPYFPEETYISQKHIFLEYAPFTRFGKKILFEIRKNYKNLYGFIDDMIGGNVNLFWPCHDMITSVYCDVDYTMLIYTSMDGITFVGDDLVGAIRRLDPRISKFINVLEGVKIQDVPKNHKVLKILQSAMDNDLAYALKLIQEYDDKIIETGIFRLNDLFRLMAKDWLSKDAKEFWEFMALAVTPKLVDIRFLCFLSDLNVDKEVIKKIKYEDPVCKEYLDYLFLERLR